MRMAWNGYTVRMTSKAESMGMAPNTGKADVMTMRELPHGDVKRRQIDRDAVIMIAAVGDIVPRAQIAQRFRCR